MSKSKLKSRICQKKKKTLKSEHQIDIQVKVEKCQNLITQLVDTFPNNAINDQIPPPPTIKYLKEKEKKKLKGDICKNL